MMQPFYRFTPRLCQTIWGGEGVVNLKGLENAPRQVGESWEISGVEGAETPVEGGEEAGATLQQLIKSHGAALVGAENYARYGQTFPLLIKFISAAQDLSIQVHPDDAMAQRMGHPYGKTEMWYLVDAAPGASLCSGFKEDFSAEAYERTLHDGTLTDHLAKHETHAGDCFFIPAGRIHSIGAGNLLVEIQQSSNDTFRVYDFNRRDAQGNLRQLHVEQAKEALCYKASDDYHTAYADRLDAEVQMVACKEFQTNLLRLTREFSLDLSRRDSFVILICYGGSGTLRLADGTETHLRAGQTLLLPATCQGATLLPEDGGFQLVETFI